MDDVTRLQAKARRDLGLARRAAAEQPAGGLQLGARGPMDGAVNPAAAHERAVGGIDDGIDVERGDISLDDVDTLGHGSLPVRRARWISLDAAGPRSHWVGSSFYAVKRGRVAPPSAGTIRPA